MTAEPEHDAKALRAEVVGLLNEHDRLWRITGPDFVVGLTEYNHELTGYSAHLRDVFDEPTAIHYGGNAYYVLNVCRKRGWKVEAVDDR